MLASHRYHRHEITGFVGRGTATHRGSPDARCSRDLNQARANDDDSDCSRDPLTGRRETFDGDGRPHDSHRAHVHESQTQEDHRQTSRPLAAV